MSNLDNNFIKDIVAKEIKKKNEFILKTKPNEKKEDGFILEQPIIDLDQKAALDPLDLKLTDILLMKAELMRREELK